MSGKSRFSIKLMENFEIRREEAYLEEILI
jgi:hypothetical protein